jgi:hypothetical protein
VTTEGNEMRIDVSSRIKVAGDYAVQWQYTGGAHALSIHRVALLCDGQEIAVDPHDAFTGAADNGNIFALKVPEIKPGAKYEIVANIKGEGGNNSNGDVWLETPEK